jgi:uncharacterized protein (UPF0332 family)
MNGDDFFAAAESLSKGTTPAEMRSSISRAYYGAFHTARDLCCSVGIALPKTADCHVKVSQILGNSGDQDVVKSASKLSSLRDVRNDADYDLTDSRPEKKNYVILQLKAADDIITNFKKHLPKGSLDPLHEALRKHAKDILKLPVKLL